MATHSIAWRILSTEEPGRLQSMEPKRIGHSWATEHTPSPKSHVYWPSPHLFGAVSQSYLRCCPLGCSPPFAQNITTFSSHVVHFCFRSAWQKHLHPTQPETERLSETWTKAPWPHPALTPTNGPGTGRSHRLHVFHSLFSAWLSLQTPTRPQVWGPPAEVEPTRHGEPCPLWEGGAVGTPSMPGAAGGSCHISSLRTKLREASSKTGLELPFPLAPLLGALCCPRGCGAKGRREGLQGRGKAARTEARSVGFGGQPTPESGHTCPRPTSSDQFDPGAPSWPLVQGHPPGHIPRWRFSRSEQNQSSPAVNSGQSSPRVLPGFWSVGRCYWNSRNTSSTWIQTACSDPIPSPSAAQQLDTSSTISGSIFWSREGVLF